MFKFLGNNFHLIFSIQTSWIQVWFDKSNSNIIKIKIKISHKTIQNRNRNETENKIIEQKQNTYSRDNFGCESSAWFSLHLAQTSVTNAFEMFQISHKNHMSHLANCRSNNTKRPLAVSMPSFASRPFLFRKNDFIIIFARIFPTIFSGRARAQPHEF